MSIWTKLFGTSSDTPLCPSCKYRTCDINDCDSCINALRYKGENKTITVRCYCTYKHDNYPAVTRCKHYCKGENK